MIFVHGARRRMIFKHRYISIMMYEYVHIYMIRPMSANSIIVRIPYVLTYIYIYIYINN